MKTATKQKNAEIGSGLVEVYRDFPRFNVADSIQGLATFLAHRSFFEALGESAMAAAAERAWWQDAVLLAREAASSADEARQKVDALQPALEGRVWATAGEGHRAVRAMITAAVEVERTRWALPRATRH